ncbi:MAG: GntR family transcriptional regulator [Gemmatimonadales bacterium]|nr:GntR family transcriptional regulator [Gemmatimonadales bacterium]MYG49766.1 GntR family transcriptional regulator [Gemmatimonadales bacterium]MYK01538.1 GntR family transcriptional regulator [Candidatus Palauibacter ramosifaciens]
MARGCGLSPLSRDHYIPLRRQLAADLEAGIRDGHVRPGAPLPSSRDMARRLGVDRGTVGAALARLRRRNLIELGKGQRPRASLRPRPLRPPPTVEMAPRAAALDLLRRAHAGGLSRWRLLNELERIVDGARSPDPHLVTLCEPRDGLRAVLAAELEGACGVVVHAVDSARRIPENSPVILRRELQSRMRRSGNVECVPISLAGGTRERELVRRRVRRGFVVLLSRSETVRVFAAELAARDFALGISFKALDPDIDASAIRRAVTAATIIFHDRLVPMARYASRTAPAVPVTLLPSEEIERLRAYLSRTDRPEHDRGGFALYRAPHPGPPAPRPRRP